jgi:cytochrome d ubiquinol oxidase subunit I
MEGLYEGKAGAGLVGVGILNPSKEIGDQKDPFLMRIELPKMLSILGYNSMSAYVPGINDLVYGNQERGIMSAQEKMAKGKLALEALAQYKQAVADKNDSVKAVSAFVFKENYKYMGFGQLEKPEDAIPPIPMVFYSFRIMVIVGGLMIFVAAIFLWLGIKNKLEKYRWLLKIGIWMFPISFLASMAGWVVVEVGRQPWTIDGLLSTSYSTSNITTTAVLLTFWIFLSVLIALVIAEFRIMLNAIKKGPNK